METGGRTEMVNIEQIIHEFLTSQSDVPINVSGIAPDQSLIASGLIDSFAVVEILEFLEKRFDIVFEPDDLTGENFDSIAAMANLVRDRIGRDR